MAGLDVGSMTVPQVLAKLHSGQHLVPSFQRQFVWTISQVEEFASSVLRGRPIGMTTLWELGEESKGIAEEHVSLVDRVKVTDPKTKTETIKDQVVAFGSSAGASHTRFAILDGRQRCTALAMVFGGLRTSGNIRTSGRFFLNLDGKDEACWVKFFREADVKKLDLGSPAGALAKGWMPLAVSGPTWACSKEWRELLVETLTSPSIYPNNKLPDEAVLAPRKARINASIDGITSVQLATYTVGAEFDLGDICEIFETLNTTGTKVSTVDLVHSFVYQDTDKAMSVRGWIDELGGLDGAEGWASSRSKPERIAQIVTASYVGLQDLKKKPEPRSLGGKGGGEVSSVKAEDILRTPSAHWKNVKESQVDFAEMLKHFQLAVAGGRFPLDKCPYPASAAVYSALAWSKKVESIALDKDWGKEQLDPLFRAFFWRNVMATRYDQGFLTQVTADVKALRDTLRLFGEVERNFGAWAVLANKALGDLIGEPPPSEKVVTEWIWQGQDTGAKRMALRLLPWAKTTNDLLSAVAIDHPDGVDADLHHIWPKAWINANKVGGLDKVLDQAKDKGWDRVNCAANLVPLSGKSNRDWKAKNPGQALKAKVPTYEMFSELLDSAFIDAKCFQLLTSGKPSDLDKFQKQRAALMAKEICARMTVKPMVNPN